MSGIRIAYIAPALLVLAGALTGCDGNATTSKAATAPPPPPLVTVAKPVSRMLAEHEEYVGRFVAVDSIEVRARVSGYLENVHFIDGAMVQKGDKLFTIDQRPFEATVEQAQGTLAQSKANLAFAESDLKRGEGLVRGTTITQQTLDQRIQAKRVAEASVQAQEAALRQARLDLQFTELTAPVSGRIGDRRVSPGNLVTGGTSGNTTLLATIVTTDPIRFEFTMDEQSYLKYLRAEAANAGAQQGGQRDLKLTAQLKLIDEKEFMHDGRVDFLDNAIDPSTGTIRARAEFANVDGRLTPGMFGRIRIATSAPETTLLVPDAAIATEQVRKFVYAVDGNGVATAKFVTLGALVDGLRVVKSGLSADDVVVVKGLMRVRPGAKVTPQKETTERSVEKTARTN